jgi:hypothetical protein
MSLSGLAIKWSPAQTVPPPVYKFLISEFINCELPQARGSEPSWQKKKKKKKKNCLIYTD